MRLQKYLALSGVASRRRSEELIAEGKIKVNNEIITEMGFKVDPERDRIFVDGKEVLPTDEKVYILLNKPTGYITTVSEQFQRKKVTDLINVPQRIFPVGRLDYDTSGLLLLTNDGDLTYRLTHPRFKVEKKYISKIQGIPTKDMIAAFKRGLKIEDYITAPANFKIIKTEGNDALVEITIHEGKNRQIRKMCDAIGHPVITLQRISMGNLALGRLKVGEWRFLSEEEIRYLKGI